MNREDVFKISTYRPFLFEALKFFFVRFPSYIGSLLLLVVLWLILSNGFGEGLGLSNLFRDRPDVQGLIPGAARNSPALWTGAFVAFSSCLIMAYPAFDPYFQDFEGRIDPDSISLRNSVIFFLAGSLLVGAILTTGWAGADKSALVDGEILRAVIGIPVGLVVFGIAISIGALTRWWFKPKLDRRIDALAYTTEQIKYDGLLTRSAPTSRLKKRGSEIYWTGFRRRGLKRLRSLLLTLSFTLPLLILLGVAFYVGNLIPAVAIFVLILSIFLTLKLIGAFPMGARIAILVLIGIVVSASYDSAGTSGEGIRYKHAFDRIPTPDGANHYETPLSLAAGPPAPADQCGPNGPLPDRVDFESSLRAWKEFQSARYGVEKPKLVLVATSGGAYRASFWTSLVLDRLVAQNNSKDLRGLADGVHLITGASGGMVGAAYFAALAGQQPRLTATPGITRAIEEDILRAQSRSPDRARPKFYTTNYTVPRDSLSGVAQHLLQRDLFSVFKAGFAPVDRGEVLENHWGRLAVPFADWADGERQGWRPAIIHTPMLVETGQPLVISNLDLGFLPQIAQGEAVEMFSLFPCAPTTFHIGTAVRMNASFPFISPAVSLPTEPHRRVVDAGYYDNYGVSFLNALLSLGDEDCVPSSRPSASGAKRQPFCFRDWIKRETSGVVLIEIRAFGLGTEDEVGPPCEASTLPAGWNPSVAFLSSPIEAVLSARSRSMVFRNEQGRRRITQFDQDLPLDRVVFAYCEDGAMSWIVPPDEFDHMKAALDEQWQLQRDNLVTLWNDR